MLLSFVLSAILITARSAERLSPEEADNASFDQAMQIRRMCDGPDTPSLRQQQQALNRLVSLSGFGFVAPISKAAANMSLHAKDTTKFLNSIALNSFDAVVDKSATKDGNGQMYSTKVSVENGEVLIVMEFPKDQVFVWVTRKNPRAVRELGKAFRDGFGLWSGPHHRLSLELLRIASDLGDAEAQGQMALRYSLGLHLASSWTRDGHGIAKFNTPDQEKAILHYYFAAKSGDDLSHLVLGFKHMHGLGVPKSCWSAVSYYQPVAEKVVDLSVVPDALPSIERLKLSKQNAGTLKSDRSQKEVLQYYQYNADMGNVDAQAAVGQVFNFGSHGMERDHEQALKYLQLAADAGDEEAMAHLGHMHANGFGTEKNLKKAKAFFEAASKGDSRSSQYALGYMYLMGEGVEVDHGKAMRLLAEAAGAGHVESNFLLGVIHQNGIGVKKKSPQRALQHYTLASHGGHILAGYNAAMMHLAGIGVAKTCKPALEVLKVIAEKGPWASALQLGHEAFFSSKYSRSLLQYLEAAEMGMELGQANAAWLMRQAYILPSGLRPRVTFDLYQASALQGNVQSLLTTADAFMSGEGVEQDWERSAAIYYQAQEERSPQAMFHLGYAHEFGAGVPKDLKLARKWYKMAEHVSKDSFLPVRVALSWLAVHEVWEATFPSLPLSLQPPHTSLIARWISSSSASSSSSSASEAVKNMVEEGEEHDMAFGSWFRLLRVVEAATADVLEPLGITWAIRAVFGDGDESFQPGGGGTDTLLLFVLVLLLSLVLRLRANLRARATRDEPEMGVNHEEGPGIARGHEH